MIAVMMIKFMIPESDDMMIITDALKVNFILQAVLSVFVDTTFLFGMPILEGRGPSAGLENIQDK